MISTIANDCFHNNLIERHSMDDIVSHLHSELDRFKDLSPQTQTPTLWFPLSWVEYSDPSPTSPLALSWKNPPKSLVFLNCKMSIPTKAQRNNFFHLNSHGDNDGPVFKRRLVEVQLKIYTFDDMKRATQDFHLPNLLGEGGFGKVYRGWVNEKTLQPCKPGRGISVAIKKHYHGGMHGNEKWKADVIVSGRLSSRHPNLVKMFGYCKDKRQLCLVYEFVENGSLDKHLFTKVSISKGLSWDIRLKIAIGAAQGLAFLHNSSPSIIMRDVKPSNILLDKDYNAKLSDFGLAKDYSSFDVSTRVVGTYGYAAPEYVLTGLLTIKSDVYSFGVVLLEIFTGLRVIDNNRQPEQRHLVKWAMPYLDSERIKSILDFQIEGQYSFQGALKAGKIIQRCLHEKAKERPSMNEVVEALEELD